jgi:thioredoxin-like negative regulator of GroEL
MFVSLIAATIASLSVLAVPPDDYATAYEKAEKSGKPLMVVISAPWCPACVSLKNTTLREMESGGQLEDVSVVVIDRDRDSALAERLMRGQMIPQVIVFSKRDTGRWQRAQLTGFQTPGTIRQLLRNALSPMARS